MSQSKVTTHTVGRVLTVDLGPGQPVVESLLHVAAEAGIRFASLTLVGNLSAARMILGQRRYSRASRDPDRVSFDDEREALGSGELQAQAPESGAVALRIAVGREREVFVADVVEATVGTGARVTLTELLAQP